MRSKEKLRIKVDAGMRCHLCQNRFPPHELQIHHSIPVSLGIAGFALYSLCEHCHQLSDILALDHGIEIQDTCRGCGGFPWECKNNCADVSFFR